jgi:sterol 3beta-glucosyltransferase
MHYGIVAIGSRGDVQPFVALALGLKNRGHGATLMAHENFKEFVEGFGVSFVPLRGNVEEMLLSDEGMKVLRKGDIFSFSQYLKKISSKTAETILDDILQACQKSDFLVTSLLALPWVDSVAEKLGKHWAIIQLSIPTVPTGDFPFAFMDIFNSPAFNLFTYRFYEFVYHHSGKKIVNKFRASLGLPKLKVPLLKQIETGKIPNLHCISPSLLARPNDWAANNDITGFLFLPESLQKNIPDNLIQWLAEGDKPIYIGFGSIPVPDTNLLQKLIQHLLDTTSHRIIFCYGWSPTIRLPENPRLFIIDTVSHQWMIPRCKAAVIHGGVGTTAAGLQAGIPLVIASIIADQPWLGKLIEQKKLGVHIPFKKLNPQNFTDAIERTQNIDIIDNAKTISKQINRENGVEKTLDRLETYFKLAQFQKD